jgi:hypothetical protein
MVPSHHHLHHPPARLLVGGVPNNEEGHGACVLGHEVLELDVVRDAEEAQHHSYNLFAVLITTILCSPSSFYCSLDPSSSPPLLCSLSSLHAPRVGKSTVGEDAEERDYVTLHAAGAIVGFKGLPTITVLIKMIFSEPSWEGVSD